MCLAPRPACAHLRNYLVNYGWYTLEKGRVEMELWTDYRRPDVGDSKADFWAHQTELEFGVTDRYSLGLYGVFVEGVGYTAAKLENRYRFGHKGEWPVDLAGYLEFKKANGDKNEDEIEGKLILSKDVGNLNLVANPILAYEREEEPSGEKEWELEKALALGAAYPLGKVTPGLELFLAKEKTQVIPGLYIDIIPNVRLNLGVAFGSGEEANDVEYKSILELEF